MALKEVHSERELDRFKFEYDDMKKFAKLCLSAGGKLAVLDDDEGNVLSVACRIKPRRDKGVVVVRIGKDTVEIGRYVEGKYEQIARETISPMYISATNTIYTGVNRIDNEIEIHDPEGVLVRYDPNELEVMSGKYVLSIEGKKF